LRPGDQLNYADPVLIASRFCGPPSSANGGYTAGLLGSALGGSVEVTLRSPPRLEHELRLEVTSERAQLTDGDVLVADARRAPVELEAPARISFERAVELSAHYVGLRRHHFPGCFVCGPARAVGDGLRIFPGSERPGEAVAAPWLPDPGLADEQGSIRSEFSWAALDCIGYFAIAAPDYPLALLGRITAHLIGSLQPEERCVVQGFGLGREGRKLHAGTALYGSDGQLRGLARQTWIVV
jgi:hypothetical protein